MVAALLFATGPAAADDKGVGDRRSRLAAQQAIPWRELSAADRREVSAVVSDATLYRQLPTRLIDCDGDLFAYLVDHPDVVVDCWNVMGVSRLQLEALEPGRYHASDSVGAEGEVRVIHRTGGGAAPLTMLIAAKGRYQTHPMPHPLRGESVLLLRANAVEQGNGRAYITTRLDSFIRFDQVGTKLVAKTLKPLIVRTADHNFIETMRFIAMFNRTAETNPQGIERLSNNLRHTDAATRREFAQVGYETSQRYADRRRQRVALRQPTAVSR